MTGYAVDDRTLEQLIDALDQCIDQIGAVDSHAAAAAAEGAVPDTELPSALRRFGVELRSTINECRQAAALSRSAVHRNANGYDMAEQLSAEQAAAVDAHSAGGRYTDRPIGAPVRAW